MQIWSLSCTCPQNIPGVYTAAVWLAVLSQAIGPGPKYFISQLKQPPLSQTHIHTHPTHTCAHTRGDECVITLIKLLLEGRRSSVGNGGETHRWLFTSLYFNHSWNREGEAEKYECTAWWGLGKLSVFITQWWKVSLNVITVKFYIFFLIVHTFSAFSFLTVHLFPSLVFFSSYLFLPEGGAAASSLWNLKKLRQNKLHTASRYSRSLSLFHTHTHTHTHTHVWSAILVGTLHRRNGFYTVQTVFSIALHQPYT